MGRSQFIEVSIDQIDLDDRTYVITFESPISQLIYSIKKIGIIHPPMLEKKTGNTYRVVSGLKRILALKHLNVTQFPAGVFFSTGSEPNIELFLLNLYENIGTRNLNHIEKSQVLYKLINLFKLSEEQVIMEFLPQLNLGENKLVLSRYLKLIHLEDNLKIAIVEDFISIDIAIALLERSKNERQAIFELFQWLKLGKNRQKEFMRLLQEIAEISGRSIEQLLFNSKIQDVLSKNKITPPRKIEYIKEILKKMRYPLFASMEDNFQKIKKDLKLPPNIILRPPPFFEGEKYTIEFTFENQSEFKKLTEILKSISEQNKLAKLESLV